MVTVTPVSATAVLGPGGTGDPCPAEVGRWEQGAGHVAGRRGQQMLLSTQVSSVLGGHQPHTQGPSAEPRTHPSPLLPSPAPVTPPDGGTESTPHVEGNRQGWQLICTYTNRDEGQLLRVGSWRAEPAAAAMADAIYNTITWLYSTTAQHCTTKPFNTRLAL